MKTKKVAGYVLLILAVVLTAAVVGQIANIIGAGIGVWRIFREDATASEVGFAFGQLAYWVIHIGIVVIFYIYGQRWTKKSPTSNQESK